MRELEPEAVPPRKSCANRAPTWRASRLPRTERAAMGQSLTEEELFQLIAEVSPSAARTAQARDAQRRATTARR